MSKRNGITLGLIGLWFALVMVYPMLFKSPTPDMYLTLANAGTALFLSPILIAIVYMIKRWSFFDFHPYLFGPTLMAFSLVGYVGVGMFNFSYMIWKGVDPYGYTLLPDTVLYQGRVIKEADVGSFQTNLDPQTKDSFDGMDSKRKYLKGEALNEKQ